MLEREILLQLHGDDPHIGGLFRGLLACQTMEEFCRTKAEIHAYEKVLELMRDVARKMNEQDQTQPTMRVRAN